MGRTLHYSIEKSKKFTDREALAMVEISQKYDRLGVWTCESFFLDVYSYYPNWERGGGKAKNWEQINGRYDEIAKTGKNHIEIVKQLVAEKLVMLDSDDRSKTRGFTKTQGNEFNSLLVYMALVEISKAIPTAKIHLTDEGELLFCSLYIRQGKVLPDIEDLNNQIKRWASIKTLTGKTTLMNKLNREIVNTMNDDTKRLFGLENSYKSYADRYLEKYLNKARIVGNIISENWTYCEELKYNWSPKTYLGRAIQINEHNIANMPVKFWFKPKLFARCVDLKALQEKYVDYGKKDWAERLMQGFDGETFGLVEEGTEEVNSYKNIAFIQKLVKQAGLSKDNLQIGAEIKTR